MNVLYLILALAFAGDASMDFKYGLGVFIKEKPNRFAEVKHFSLSYRDSLVGVLDHKAEVGLFADIRCCKNRKSSMYGGYSVGMRLERGIIYTSTYWGVALISNPDNRLSSPFNFMGDLSVGLTDGRRYIGVNYKHLSNAGLSLPNKGRDFVSIEVGAKFN